ncbi:MAG: DUF4384 domain-containing protein [Gemmatimonadales bacterium]|nr:DUF4384 domain-containing protein [Gemmatimonadales bacterium]NIN50719.1 DUF4384 domain-containing protein [Gemmatimonadales bacterium]NIP08183.1 DUF4384 domain-containing protein [Gemmatimonadales bacterium]NIR01061.1 DUF4384 domain-containing protein [Gemmatimonadales bacterium]NIS65140.1 DUF4384 domain-containing protein [Gemmatimonadales bacterium]
MIAGLLAATLSIASPSGGGAAGGTPEAHPWRARSTLQPGIEVWTNDRDHFRRGDRVYAYFRTATDGYVSVFRVDTDGRVRFLFPREPWEDNFVRGGRQYAVDDPYLSGRHAFVVDDYPGQGYLFAVASLDPFRYGALVSNDHWDYRAVAQNGRITGDPYVALTLLIDQIVEPGYAKYSYDVFPYFVERRYGYPRFLCYDCHSYVAYPVWDPYREWCGTFRIVIYDAPYYYPAHTYPATQVVYSQPRRPEPRFVFKERRPSDPYVTTERRRPANQPAGRRPADRGVTGRDLGGVGRVPAPATRRPESRGSSILRRMLGDKPARSDTRAKQRREVLPQAKPQLERRSPQRAVAPQRSNDPRRAVGARPAATKRRPTVTSGTRKSPPRRRIHPSTTSSGRTRQPTR